MKVTLDGNRVVAVTFTMPGTPPSPNRQRGQHWGQTNREQGKWRDDTATVVQNVIRLASVLHDFGELPWRDADIVLTYRFAHPTRRDIPNFIAAAKGLIDGVVKGGLLKDDSSVYLDSVECHIQRRLVPAPDVVVTVRRCIH